MIGTDREIGAVATRPSDEPVLRMAADADAALLVDVLEMAGRGHLERGVWDVMFPDEAERRRALDFVATKAARSWCHRQFFHVGEIGGRGVAAMVAFETGADLNGDSSLGPALFGTFEFLGWSPERVSVAMESVGPYMTCFPDMPTGTWIVENVGTLPEARRRGITRVLLERCLAEGRRRGCESAQISCLIGNDPAQCAYERAGFEVVEERRDPAFEKLIGAAGFSRMTMRL